MHGDDNKTMLFVLSRRAPQIPTPHRINILYTELVMYWEAEGP